MLSVLVRSGFSLTAKRSFSQTSLLDMRVVPIPMREDNYAYLVIDDKSNKAAVVDPYNMSKVNAAANEERVEIVATITTHHHFDHSDGNNDFAEAYKSCPIYGGSKKVQAVTKIVKDQEEFQVTDDLHVKCLATPCHTQDSICYYVTDKSNPSQSGVVFTGDTLFQAGCGRFFEGDGTEMHSALSHLGKLPDETVVYNGHEYTASNLAFAKSVEPGNPAMQRLQDLVANNKITTGKSTIGDEKEWNVFMRLGTEAIRNAAGASPATPDGTVMDQLREMKNKFRG
ncbi:hydroxyacylglutathione hydrolase [Rickenella mellea]|uniref:hydroxyacylglutathione hydrolase n=1 Tax=Rickenella mellea TaxID=50990 RepID=A0A4Y7QJK2_9AGAM|nr:hydroxyacylglutathione hydrolase [Rickenella mellea]